jgi:hypothetical protein
MGTCRARITTDDVLRRTLGGRPAAPLAAGDRRCPPDSDPRTPNDRRRWGTTAPVADCCNASSIVLRLFFSCGAGRVERDGSVGSGHGQADGPLSRIDGPGRERAGEARRAAGDDAGAVNRAIERCARAVRVSLLHRGRDPVVQVSRAGERSRQDRPEGVGTPPSSAVPGHGANDVAGGCPGNDEAAPVWRRSAPLRLERRRPREEEGEPGPSTLFSYGAPSGRDGSRVQRERATRGRGRDRRGPPS